MNLVFNIARQTLGTKKDKLRIHKVHILTRCNVDVQFTHIFFLHERNMLGGKLTIRISFILLTNTNNKRIELKYLKYY